MIKLVTSPFYVVVLASDEHFFSSVAWLSLSRVTRERVAKGAEFISESFRCHLVTPVTSMSRMHREKYVEIYYRVSIYFKRGMT